MSKLESLTALGGGRPRGGEGGGERRVLKKIITK